MLSQLELSIQAVMLQTILKSCSFSASVSEHSGANRFHVRSTCLASTAYCIPRPWPLGADFDP